MSGTDLPVLRGSRVTLRRPGLQDVAARLKIAADPEIYRMYGGSRADLRPMTEDEAGRWVERLLNHDYAWVITDDDLIGQIRLDHVDLGDRRANLSVGIEIRERLGIGLGTEAVRLVLDYAFGVLKLHRVSARVVEFNARAIRAYEKCGFVPEGREREAACVDGVRYDDVMMGVLEREFRQTEGNAR